MACRQKLMSVRSVACFLLGLFLFPAFTIADDGTAPKRVLLISSYHPGFTTFFDQIEGGAYYIVFKGIPENYKFTSQNQGIILIEEYH